MAELSSSWHHESPVFHIRLAVRDDPERARRILTAATLTINDRAPALYAGLAPENTNPFDIDSYSKESM